jgi:hypothetical protein
VGDNKAKEKKIEIGRVERNKRLKQVRVKSRRKWMRRE